MGNDKNGPDVELWVNGRELSLAPFVKEIIASTVLGMVRALKGGENAQEVSIRIRAKGEGA